MARRGEQQSGRTNIRADRMRLLQPKRINYMRNELPHCRRTKLSSLGEGDEETRRGAYYPSGTLGLLLIVLIVLALMDSRSSARTRLDRSQPR
jgi:Protein of unknown function (DUF3309)